MRFYLIKRYVEDGCYPEGLDGMPVPMLFNKLAYPNDLYEWVEDKLIIFNKESYKEFLERKNNENVNNLIEELGTLYLEDDNLLFSEINDDDVIFFVYEDILDDICNDNSISKEDITTEEYLLDGNVYEWIDDKKPIDTYDTYFNIDRFDGIRTCFHSVGRHAQVYCVKTFDDKPVQDMYLVRLWSQWEGEKIDYGCVMDIDTLHEYFTLNLEYSDDEWEHFLAYEREAKNECC